MRSSLNVWFFLTLVLALTYAWPSPSSSIRETNAQRLAQGLPPNPPKFIQELLAKRAQKTPGRVDLGSRPSSVPHVKLSGKLQLRSPEDGSALGNVRNWPGGGTISGTNFLGSDGDLLVELKFNPAKPFKINILATNPTFPAPFFVGAGSISPLDVPVLVTGSRNTVSFTNVERTLKNAGPTSSPTRNAFVESAIWSIDIDSHKLTAQWINADGSKPPTVLAYDIRENEIFFVGDLAVYNSENDLPASAVDLFLVPA
ncbi:hypothetical protein CPC08DRAFT_749144 [Agrocybe pediades]|nr:hypothetical protein CPC08DRAFT_749144 [Agrocybe pediades]